MESFLGEGEGSPALLQQKEDPWQDPAPAMAPSQNLLVLMASRAVGTAGSPGQGSCFPQLSSSLQQGKQQGFTPPLPSLVTNTCLKLSTSLNPGTGSSLELPTQLW